MAAARWSLARAFLVVGSVLPVLYLVAFTGLAWLHFGPVPYFVVTMAIVGIVGIFWPDRWLMLVTGVVAIVAVAGSFAAGAEGDPGTFRPDRTLEWSYWWLATLLAPSLLVAGIVHFVQAKHRSAPPLPGGRWGVAGVALVLALYVGGLATALQEKAFVPAGEATAVGMRPDVTASLTAKDDLWSPTTLASSAGNVVKLTVTNADAGAHVLDQDDVGLRVDLPAGATKTVWLRLDAAGTFQYYCELHAAKGADGKWAGMVGTLTVA